MNLLTVNVPLEYADNLTEYSMMYSSFLVLAPLAAHQL